MVVEARLEVQWEAIRHHTDQSSSDFDGRLPTSHREMLGFHPDRGRNGERRRRREDREGMERKCRRKGVKKGGTLRVERAIEVGECERKVGGIASTEKLETLNKGEQ